MAVSLLSTKLYIPPLRRGLVSRPRLLDRLNDGFWIHDGLGQGPCFGRKLTLVSAPAGYGKTTLVSEWIGCWEEAPGGEGGLPPSKPLQAAWLSLDGGDNDPARFTGYLVAALQSLDPGIGGEAQAMMRAPQPPPPEALLTSLINDLTATSVPGVLVLDDYHLIHSMPIHHMLGYLLAHQPPCLHLVLATREDPPLPLPRLRARAQVVEIRQSDLQFTPQEAIDFLQQTMQLELSPDNAAALHQRTEGWVAALQLAGLQLAGLQVGGLQVGGLQVQGRALRGGDGMQQVVRSFAGSDRYVLDYLVDEVFRQQTTDVQEFLLQTSILDRLNAPLCDTVTGREDGRRMLLALERANLFVIPLDGSRQWYRYHRLFAELLSQRARLEWADRLPALHRLASRWYADHGYPADAVQHALAAADWERAAALLVEVSSEMLRQAEVRTLLGWFQAMPVDYVLSDPQLCFEYCWPLILTDQIEAAERYLAVAEAAAGEDPSLWGEIAVARAHIARAQGDGPRVIEFSERALSLLPAEDLSSRSIVAINLGIAQWYRGRLDESVRALSEAQRAASGAGNGYVRTTAQVFRARIEAVRGGPYRAADAYRQAIREGGQSPAVAMAHIDLGKLLYEWNDLDAAAGHLQQALDLCRSAGSVEIQLSAAVVLALVLQRLDHLVEAQDVLQESWSLAQHRDVSPFGRLNALGYRALIALAAGDLDQAARWVEQYPAIKEIPSLPQYLLLCLARARLLLAQGRHAEAARVLDARYGAASQAGFGSALGETRAMQALVAPTPGEARAHLSQALAAAEPEGRVRAFLDLGQPMADLLQQAVAQGIAAGYSSKLLAAFQPSRAQGPGSRTRPGARRDHKPATLNSRPEPLDEPLSERELEALCLLAAGYTYQEIAQALYVSVNTVKTHLKSVYAKLRVHTRRQATAKARALGLITNHP